MRQLGEHLLLVRSPRRVSNRGTRKLLMKVARIELALDNRHNWWLTLFSNILCQLMRLKNEWFFSSDTPPTLNIDDFAAPSRRCESRLSRAFIMVTHSPTKNDGKVTRLPFIS